jgi:hypothetical protein
MRNRTKVYQLLFCGMCQKHIQPRNTFNLWEEDIYCDACFDKYTELISDKNIPIYPKDEHTYFIKTIDYL